MIYLTQLIFVKEGKEEIFLTFEEFAIPLMQQYNVRILYRVRPNKENFISEKKELPYEIHFISFESDEDLDRFLKDDTRLDFMHLKNESVKTTLLIKGAKM